MELATVLLGLQHFFVALLCLVALQRLLLRASSTAHSLVLVGCPQELQHCNGRYELLPAGATGTPIWRKLGTPRWLFRAPDGRWYVTGPQQRFDQNRGYLRSARAVTCPEVCSEKLERPDDQGGWRSDGQMLLQVPAEPPGFLFVTGCSDSLRCTGRYELVPEHKLNGEPVWRMMNGSKWLHISDRGDWHVSNQDIAEGGFSQDKSHLRCPRMACWPSDCAGVWDQADGQGGWKRVSKIRVTIPAAPPARLFLAACPKKRAKCEGCYELTSMEANGECIWQQTNGVHWIFLAPAGTWNIFNAEREQVDFGQDRGVIMSARTGCWPHECCGSWLFTDSGSWRPHKDITFSSMVEPPRILVLSGCPAGRLDCEGRYVLQANRRPQGVPLWRQEGGSQWLFLGPNGKWHINGAGSERSDFRTTEAIIYSERVGRWPHECIASWQYTDLRGGWVKENNIVFREATCTDETERRPAKRARRATL